MASIPINPLVSASYEGLPGGMNTALPAHELPPTQARYMQDIILNRPGIIQRRGLLSKVSGSAQLAARVTGLIMCQDPTGAYQFAALRGDATHGFMDIFSSNFSSVTTFDLNFAPNWFFPDPTKPQYIVDCKPALGGGVWVGVSADYRPSTAQAGLFLWYGAVASSNAVTTFSITPVTTGATNFTVTSATGIVPGMFVINGATNSFMGVVLSVVGTTVTLVSGSLNTAAVGNQARFHVARGFGPKAMAGLISTSTNSATVTGTQGPGGTKFVSQDTASSFDYLYRLSDSAFIGRLGGVTQPTNEASCTLLANALVNMTDERYFAPYISPNPTYFQLNILTAVNPIPGFLNAVWNNRQWFANNQQPMAAAGGSSRVYFSDPADAEGIDFSNTGSFLNVNSPSQVNTPIVGLWATPGGLVVMKEEELFLIVGTDPTNFSIRKIADIGCLYGGAIQPWNNGIIWPCDSSIYYFDGTKLRDMAPQLGDWYVEGLKNFSYKTDRAGAIVYKDHYIVYFDRFISNIPVTKGVTPTNPTKLTLCLNLETGAVTTWTNMAIKASVMPPNGSGLTPLFLVDDGGSPGTTSLCDIGPMLLTNPSGTADSITCGGASTGPDFYIETQKYNFGDPERKKLFKQMMMTYIANGGTLSVDTVPGLNTVGTTSASVWLATTTFANKRIKFLKRDQHLSVRIYCTAQNLVDIQIGPISFAWKWQRVGRP